jgi:uncharacterized protein YbjQ (UPF0145 family)
MVKKKAETKDQSHDLTRIEDLSEFLHQEDSELDSVFENLSPVEATENFELSEITNLNLSSGPSSLEEEGLDSDNLPNNFESNELEEVSFESLPDTDLGFDPNEQEEILEEEIIEEDALEETNLFESHTYESSSTKEEIDEDNDDEINEDIEAFNYAEPAAIPEPVYTNTSEKFEDVKTFAQNFSYGKTSLKGGNPPYTIIARHIKFQEDADDILNLLEEFGLINDQNMRDTKKALEFGSLIIPQISEYTAIVLAHKMRRFDLDLEVGLSDEIHPSKSGEENPKGLLKKDNLKQNRTENVNFSELASSIKDIIVSTTASIPGYYVENYIGVQTTFSIVEENELEKLQYVEKVQREHSELYDYNSADLSTEQAFRDYQNSFALIYDDLAAQLKQKAFTQNANALLGLSFQLSPLQYERSHVRVNAYQITCSATLAVVGKEKS